MRFVALNDASTTNVVQTAGGVLVTGREQETARIDGYGGDRAALHGQVGRGSDHLNGLACSQVPETTRLVARARHEHVLGARPRVERVDVLSVARIGAHWLETRAVCDVYLAVASTARHEQRRVRLMHEYEIANRAVVTRQFRFRF